MTQLQALLLLNSNRPHRGRNNAIRIVTLMAWRYYMKIHPSYGKKRRVPVYHYKKLNGYVTMPPRTIDEIDLYTKIKKGTKNYDR